MGRKWRLEGLRAPTPVPAAKPQGLHWALPLGLGQVPSQPPRRRCDRATFLGPLQESCVPGGRTAASLHWSALETEQERWGSPSGRGPAQAGLLAEWGAPEGGRVRLGGEAGGRAYIGFPENRAVGTAFEKLQQRLTRHEGLLGPGTRPVFLGNQRPHTGSPRLRDSRSWASLPSSL